MSVTTGPRLERRVKTLNLPAPYEGFEFDAWVNAPAGLWQTILQPQMGATVQLVADELMPIELNEATDDEYAAAETRVVERQERVLKDALGQLIVSHNGWCDFEGNLMPQPSDDAFYEIVPTEMLGAMIATMQDVQKKLAVSIRKKRRRR